MGIVTKNFGFFQLCIIFIVVCLFNGNFVFGQEAEEETSEPSLLDYLGALAPYAAILGSALLGPLIVHQWRDHEIEIEQERNDLERKTELEQKEVELKTRIAGEISERVMRILVAIMKVEEFMKEEEKEEEEEEDSSKNQKKQKQQKQHAEELKFGLQLKALKDARSQEYLNEFKIKSHVIQSEIQAYFDGSSLRKWNVLIDYVGFVEDLSDKVDCKERRKFIKEHLEHDKGLNEYEPLGNNEEDNTKVFKKLLTNSTEKFKDGNPNKLNEEVDKFKKCNPGKQSMKYEELKEEVYENMLAERKIKAWYGVKHAIVEEKDKIVTSILKEKSSFFHPEMSYRTVENFLKKLYQTREYYIDSEAKEIQQQGGSLAEKLSEALADYQRKKMISATGIPEPDVVVQCAVSSIDAARMKGVVKERRVFTRTLKKWFTTKGKDRIAQTYAMIDV